jgi:hypothetical protein
MQFTTSRIYPVAASYKKPDGFTSGSINFSFNTGDVITLNCFQGDMIYVEKPGILSASSPVYDAGIFYYTTVGQNESSNTTISITLNYDRNICAAYNGGLGEKVWFLPRP